MRRRTVFTAAITIALAATASLQPAAVARPLAGGKVKVRIVGAKKGTITYRVKIDLKARTSRWTITSGTKKYAGLRGRGKERENADHTVVVLTGTVSR